MLRPSNSSRLIYRRKSREYWTMFIVIINNLIVYSLRLRDFSTRRCTVFQTNEVSQSSTEKKGVLFEETRHGNWLSWARHLASQVNVDLKSCLSTDLCWLYHQAFIPGLIGGNWGRNILSVDWILFHMNSGCVSKQIRFSTTLQSALHFMVPQIWSAIPFIKIKCLKLYLCKKRTIICTDSW